MFAFLTFRRLQCIWSHLVATGLADQCVKVAREANLEEIRSVHSEAHTIQYGVTAPLHCTSSKFQVLPCGGQGVDSDTYWNESYTSQAAKIAAGTVIELSTLVSALTFIDHLEICYFKGKIKIQSLISFSLFWAKEGPKKQCVP